MGWQNDKGLPPHNANPPGNLEFAPGIREFAQNTLLGENDQIWQPFPPKGPKYPERTGTSDVIFNLTGSTHYTDGSSSRPINITIWQTYLCVIKVWVINQALQHILQLEGSLWYLLTLWEFSEIFYFISPIESTSEPFICLIRSQHSL